MNRRRIRERMTELRRRLETVEKQRELRRKSREKNEIPEVEPSSKGRVFDLVVPIVVYGNRSYGNSLIELHDILKNNAI